MNQPAVQNRGDICEWTGSIKRPASLVSPGCDSSTRLPRLQRPCTCILPQQKYNNSTFGISYLENQANTIHGLKAKQMHLHRPPAQCLQKDIWRSVRFTTVPRFSFCCKLYWYTEHDTVLHFLSPVYPPFRTFFLFSRKKKQSVRVVPAKHCGSMELVLLHRRRVGIGGSDNDQSKRKKATPKTGPKREEEGEGAPLVSPRATPLKVRTTSFSSADCS